MAGYAMPVAGSARKPRVRVAIIGTGISGNAAAYLLHAQHDITVYEASARPGGHSRTVTVQPKGAPAPIAVDTGFIVFNHRNYPELTGLFRHLGVATQPAPMTFCVSAKQGAMEYSAASPNALFGQRGNLLRPHFWRMLWHIVRFNKAARAVLNQPENRQTLGELVAQLGLGQWFLQYYLLPMGGAIWSCSPAQMLAFPARTFVQFFENHGLLTITDQPQWHTVVGGSQMYVEKLVAPWRDRLKLNCGATEVVRLADGRVQVSDVQGGVAVYDEVIFACHSDQALALLKDADALEQEILAPMRYQPNRAVLHTDARFMPVRKRCWGSWVYLTDGAQPDPTLSLTYWMNALQTLPGEVPLLVTLNPAQPIPPEHVLDEATFHHPVFDVAMIDSQTRMPELQGRRGLWFAGAYLRYGFHEDGIQSAVAIARAWGVEIPWHRP